MNSVNFAFRTDTTKNSIGNIWNMIICRSVRLSDVCGATSKYLSLSLFFKMHCKHMLRQNGGASEKELFHVSSSEYYTYELFIENSLVHESTFGPAYLGEPLFSHLVRFSASAGGISSCWWNINLLMIMKFVGVHMKHNQTIWMNVRLPLTGNVRAYVRRVCYRFSARLANEKLQ